MDIILEKKCSDLFNSYIVEGVDVMFFVNGDIIFRKDKKSYTFPEDKWLFIMVVNKCDEGDVYRSLNDILNDMDKERANREANYNISKVCDAVGECDNT